MPQLLARGHRRDGGGAGLQRCRWPHDRVAAIRSQRIGLRDLPKIRCVAAIIDVTSLRRMIRPRTGGEDRYHRPRLTRPLMAPARLDVTDDLQGRACWRVSINGRVNNATFGSDPAHDRNKQLRVAVSRAMENAQTSITPEGDAVDLVVDDRHEPHTQAYGTPRRTGSDGQVLAWSPGAYDVTMASGRQASGKGRFGGGANRSRRPVGAAFPPNWGAAGQDHARQAHLLDGSQ